MMTTLAEDAPDSDSDSEVFYSIIDNYMHVTFMIKDI